MPRYPNAIQIDHFTASLLNGGGQHTYTYATPDEMKNIVDWFGEQLGPPSRETEGEVVWQWRSPGRVVEEILVIPFDVKRWEKHDLALDDVGSFRTTIVQEYHVLPKPWWRFW